MNKAFQAARIAAAVFALSLVLTTCEPLALRDLAEKLAQGGAKHLYITDRDAKRIYRCEVDGSNLIAIESLSNQNNLAMITVDPNAGKLFWTCASISNELGKVVSSDLDGSNIYMLFIESVYETVSPRGVSLKPVSSVLFWVGIRDHTIYKQSYSSSETPLASAGIGDPQDLAYCPNLEKIFVSDPANKKIHRINIDGTLDLTLDLPLTAGFQTPGNLIVDSLHGHVYWSDDGPGGGIYRCDTDLTLASVTTIVASAGMPPRQLAVDPEEGLLFWVDLGTKTIQRAKLDGSDVRTIVSGLQGPRGVALDPVRR